MEQFRYEDSSLFCEELPLTDAAKEFGTPLYVYSRQSIIDHCRWIESAFGSTDHLSCYAVKANANPSLLDILAKERIGADAGSLGELHRALNAGFPPEKITFSGVGKSDEEIEFALRKNILSFNIESREEIAILHELAVRSGMVARILLRVNFDIRPETHPYITTGRKQNKFGVDQAEALDVLAWAKTLPKIEVLGIHSHIGSQITDSATFVSAARAMAAFVNRCRERSIPMRHVNFGGGFGVQYRGYVRHPLLPEDRENPEADVTTVKMLQSVLPVLQKTGCTILIQPGRSIVAHAGVLLTKVLYRKSSGGKTFIIVDAGMNDLIRPSLYGSYHQIVPLELRNGRHETVDIVGPLCESGDFFATERAMPEVNRGDYLGILCTGAYGFVLSSNYNGRPRPAEVIIDGKKSYLSTRRESFV